MNGLEEKLNSVKLDFSEDQNTKLNKLLDIDISLNVAELYRYFERVYIPVKDGEVMCFHHKPRNPTVKRKILFVPGWGATLESFLDFYTSLIDKAEIYHLETREKNSSRIDLSKTNMSVDQNAGDIADIIKTLNLNKNNDLIVAGTCWGSSVILQGLINHVLPKAKYVLFDPMHSLWFKQWLLRWVIPFMPIWFANMIKPIGKAITLYGMTEMIQRRRTSDFIDNSDLRKWKKAAIQAGDFELIGNLSIIEHEVIIANGTRDKIHDQRYYPIIANEIPKGRFIYMKTLESKRELLVGRVLAEFTRMPPEDSIPESLQCFEIIK